MTGKPIVAIVGAGSLATFLATALHQAGFTISEIVARDGAPSRRRARTLAQKVAAQAVTARSSALSADLFWFCVPDREIRSAASALAEHVGDRSRTDNKKQVRFGFHSSGALSSRELDPLSKIGMAVASVHPLMTFVPRTHPSLIGVPFAVEGDAQAMRMARRMVSNLGGKSFRLPAEHKAAYHAWATMTSPLFLAFLVTLEEAAGAAGLTRDDARRKSLPIIRQTLANYSRLGPKHSFSGPLIRGDAKTVANHLAVLKKHPGARQVYEALAQAALRGLPVRNRNELKRLLRA